MDAKLASKVERTIRDRFSDVTIESVRIVEDVDSDGDPILVITVVYEAKGGKLDPHKTAGLVRHLRPQLIESNQRSFPILRFMSRADAARLKSAAA